MTFFFQKRQTALYSHLPLDLFYLTMNTPFTNVIVFLQLKLILSWAPSMCGVSTLSTAWADSTAFQTVLRKIHQMYTRGHKRLPTNDIIFQNAINLNPSAGGLYEIQH